MNGVNGSTTFTDSSSNSLTLSRFGDAAISTAQSRFGGASGAFDGIGDYLTVPASSSGFDFGAGDFTIEVAIRTTTIVGNRYILDLFSASTTTSTWRLLHRNDVVRFDYYDTAGTLFQISSSASISANTWADVAVVRYGNTITIYCNGSQIGSSSISGAIRASATGAVLCIGSEDPFSLFFTGNIDEVRITKGVARTIASNTAAFPDS
jgi:hypothetical protein